MKRFPKTLLAIALFSGFMLYEADAASAYSDLAVMLARGYFKNYVDPDASPAQCVAFLNSKGVCFSLFDVMDPKAEVTKEDFARVVGQSMLLFSGEADLENGCIKKPLEAKSWVDYCLLNDISVNQLWDKFRSWSSGRTRPLT